MRGVFLRQILRTGVEMPVTRDFRLQRGDTLTLVGPRTHVERAVTLIGYADRPTDETDMVVMGIGIVVGALIGALTFRLGGVPLSLSTSGGALIAGLVCGWLRSVDRTYGRVPEPALWVFNNIGLNVFIAAVGISAGPGFVAGLKAQGLELFLAGIVVTTVPLVMGLLAGEVHLPDEGADHPRRLRRRPHHHGGAGGYRGRGEEQGAGAGLHRDLCCG